MNHQITCPNCGHQFDVEEALSGKLEARMQAEYERKLKQYTTKLQAERKQLEEARKALDAQKEQQDEALRAALAKAVQEERKKIEKSAFEKFQEEISALREENAQRKSENKALKEKELDLLKKEARLREEQEELQLRIEKQMLERQKDIEEKAREKERASFELERRKLLKQIEDNKKLAEEMKRKAEQGSMQLQGEVQELALEELLKRTFPFDQISEVPKGVRGADCIQTVVNSMQQTCGTIVYESKRTKSFSAGWIEKLKQDQLTCKADIAVIVSETMPKDLDRFGQIEGVWVCGFHEVKALSFVLREMLIKTQSVKRTQENKGDKMELLYTYLTSSEFVQNVKRIIENYDAMIDQLNKEKKSMHKIWAQREKQIWVVQENIAALFGSIRGIAGKELATSEVLELPDKDIE